MYVSPNFKTKKAVKDAIASGQTVTVFTVSPFEVDPVDQAVTLEGPHYPEPHRWYAQGVVKGGKLISIK